MKEYGKCPVCDNSMRKGERCRVCGYCESLDYENYMTLEPIGEEKSTIGKSIDWKKQNDELKERQHQEEIEALQKRIEKMARQLEKQGQEAEKKAETEREATEKKLETARQEEKRKAEAEAERARQEAEEKAEAERVHQEAGKEKPDKNILKIAVVAVCAVVLVCVGIGLLLNSGGSKVETNPDDNVSTDSKVGDTVIFGSYEQDGDTSEKEDIEWTVLDEEDGKLLLVSKYILNCQPYNEEYTDVTWENCTLRSWLNEDFLNNAFSSEEQSQIEETEGINGDNPDYKYADGGEDTTDKIFLLSVAEVNEYFDSDDERECKATQYAKDQGVYTADNGNSWWWLRSAGSSGGFAAFVGINRNVYSNGNYVVDDTRGVRPALWIDPES